MENRVAGAGRVLRIVDARPWLNASANALKGKGFERARHYNDERGSAQLHFQNVGNIHEVSLPHSDSHASNTRVL